MGMPQLVDEGADDSRTQGDSKEDTIDGSPKMGVVVDIIAASFRHIDRIGQEQACIDDGRHRDTIKIDLIPGLKDDKCKEDGAYATGSSQTAIIIVILPFEIRWNIGHNDGAHVLYRVPVTLQSQISCVVNFYSATEEKEGDHVECQVKEVGMDKTAGEETIVLVAYIDRRGPEYQVIHDAGVVKGGDGDQNGKD